MDKQRIIDNLSEWIITRHGDFIHIKDSEIQIDKKLEKIRKRLKEPFQGKVRFTGKTPEQISKERYDKVWEEVNFDPEKLHEWLYDEKNKDKVEIVKLEGSDFSEAVEAIFNQVKSSRQKWRERREKKINWDLQNWCSLVNEETGQIIWPSVQVDKEYSKLDEVNRKLMFNKGFPTKRKAILIDWFDNERGNTNETGDNKYNSVIIFLHGTYGSRGVFEEIEQKFPSTKIIYPNSPTLQYDMWHGSRPAPGSQCEGWINITGDAHELMDKDVCPNNPPPKKNFEEADQIIHLDYPQLMRAVGYVNEIVEGEIAGGIPPEKIFISGYSQGGLLTLATYLTSQHKLGGFISLCRLLPCWDKLLVNPSDKNKKTPCLIVNNSGDEWVPSWTGKKSYDLLKERGYNVEFKTHPGLGHTWKNEEVEDFLTKILYHKNPSYNPPSSEKTQNFYLWWALGGIGIAILIVGIVSYILSRGKKQKSQSS